MSKPKLVTSDGDPIELIPHLPNLLLVDDTPSILRLLESIFEDDYNLPVAHNGEQAWAILEAYPDLFHVVLLDRMMPDISGTEVLKRIHKHPELKHLPIVFQTARASEVDISEGLASGADYYVTKPYDEERLLAVVKAAVIKCKRRNVGRFEMERLKGALGIFAKTVTGRLEFHIRTFEEVEKLALLLANACPEPDRVIMGLPELGYNAIEHGIINMHYDEKTTLLANDTYLSEIERRMELPEHRDKNIVVGFERFEKDGEVEIHFCVTDPGNGFDHAKYMHFDEDRLFDSHGRGIAMGAMFAFNELVYNDKGNEVTGIVKFSKE